MAIKWYSTFTKAPALLEPHHQIVLCHILDTHWERVLPLCSPSRLGHHSTVFSLNSKHVITDRGAIFITYSMASLFACINISSPMIYYFSFFVILKEIPYIIFYRPPLSTSADALNRCVRFGWFLSYFLISQKIKIFVFLIRMNPFKLVFNHRGFQGISTESFFT